ncbi:TPA: hypothetical protein JBD08_00735 [Legionella pneumophila subsp. pneumophila]|nr:hypothetical protein LPM_0502 [Legionella pneumophila subsp. pneumophila str. Mississauga]HAT9588927.1 hypothetical protein [Legionella pneumophila subsp. pneumophila]HAU1836288.1 hypothetical protein [Legionella pneumophila]
MASQAIFLSWGHYFKFEKTTNIEFCIYKKQINLYRLSSSCLIKEISSMKRYIWFHPSYVLESAETTLLGQQTNAKDHGYILLNDQELGQVSCEDHLTIMGHSSLESTPSEDTGLYMQGDTADGLIRRLTANGLKEAPKILSLESCRAGISGGLAQQLSCSLFFKYTLIEANLNSVGRKPMDTQWNFPTDSLGRAVLKLDNSPWMFYLGGFLVGRLTHDTYTMENLFSLLSPPTFHKHFFANYQPGFFGGRSGRHCLFNKTTITLEKASNFAHEDQDSASAKALEVVLKKLYSQPG